MGLPHYRSSRVSMGMYEPVYLNLFTVQITLPPAITNASGFVATDTDILLEGITKIDGLDTNKVPGVVNQRYKLSDRRFAKSGTDNTTLDIKFDFEINVRNCEAGAPDMYTLKLLRQWDDLVWDPLTGRQGLKSEYTAPKATVVMHDKKGNPFWQWDLYDVWPMSNIPAPTPDYASKDIYKVSGYTLACDYWDETMI